MPLPLPVGGLPLHVHYWDGLVGQDEEIMFTLSSSSSDEGKAIDAGSSSAGRHSVAGILGLDEAPPLELVLRTRWKGAAIDWNGV